MSGSGSAALRDERPARERSARDRLARERSAREIVVRGVVQGVGFRPFVHRLAIEHRLSGAVRNESGGVRIRVEGPAGELESFIARLEREAPPLARVESVRSKPDVLLGTSGFEVMPSEARSDRRLPVTPDVGTCDACAAELLDRSNRRYGYPFITCTDCGPRYTVIEAMPYDRERTSMRAFDQCPPCLAEYGDPGSRRYHSETNSCAECGPTVWLEVESGNERAARVVGTEAALADAAARLRRGEILAVRGIGGFHLAADATCEEAVERLRSRKGRDEKPLAVMVASLAAARSLARVGDAEAALLTSPERPIVVLRRRRGSPLARAVSPGLDTVGIVLAYTPLHTLLLRQAGGPLVMTSGNLSEEPIAISNVEARAGLVGIADAFLLHDREIVSRADDSVVRAVEGAPVFLRRGRGYAPLPVTLPDPVPEPLLAVGPQLKSTFTLAHGRQAYVSPHVGDLDNLETLEFFETALARFVELFQVEPRVVARDLHPEYLSSRFAEGAGLPVIAVQHHHAHVAAVLAEHGVTRRVLGVAYDGTGLGDDGRVWGAELLVADLVGYRRVGHLAYAPLPGGDLAAREPWRAALGQLSLAPDPIGHGGRAFDGLSGRRLRNAMRQIDGRLNAPPASSMGRLFDAAAAILGVRLRSRYEGQAAMELEALAGETEAPALPFPFRLEADGLWVMQPVPLLHALAAGVRGGLPVAVLAAGFHESVAATTASLAAVVCEREGLETVALGGGVFQNARLLAALAGRLGERGLRVLTPIHLGPNDGAISYGQAAVAAARMRRGEPAIESRSGGAGGAHRPAATAHSRR